MDTPYRLYCEASALYFQLLRILYKMKNGTPFVETMYVRLSVGLPFRNLVSATIPSVEFS